ncbi:hypothetical protein GXW71_10060 [Roseomonas hellenica]|uniref:DUF4337 domain-containing protein n=1 Tax=Plastoroseomonas hellenica TaxID=2687306 RepID=A0ABS5EXQ0_9PROT|nr:hypothetical protein [Plastoroseomonas hellenica]MBR0664695.1 hypothetical protein [Plastoroseomonas hellenica]
MAALNAAMPEFGVLPGHPEQIFIAAMMGTQRTFGEMAVAWGDDLRGLLRDARELNESELDRLREATALADLTIRQAKAAAVAAEVEQQRALGQVVKSLAPQLTEILRDTVVLKEWRHNKRLNLLHHVKVAALALVLIAGGFALRTWDTWDATASIARCMASAERNAAGRLYCPLDVMTAAAVQTPG